MTGDKQFLRIRHRRMTFDLGELVPLYHPSSGAITASDCETILAFTFNCTSYCLASQLPLSADYNEKPLILVCNAFLLDQEGRILRPIKELSRNFLVSISKSVGEVNTSSNDSRDDTPRPDNASSCTYCAPYAPASPDYSPASPMYPYVPSVTPYDQDEDQYAPSTSGQNALARGGSSGSGSTRRASKRKASRVRFS